LRPAFLQRLPTEIASRIVPLADLTAVSQVAFASACRIALVELEGAPGPSSQDLNLIRTLKGKGFQIVGCAPEPESWPLGLRAQPLLAGASWLLDSTHKAFPARLTELLRQIFREEAQRQVDEERLANTMRAVGIVGQSEGIRLVVRRLFRISAVIDLPVLIRGETGTGKDLVARAVARLDPKHGPGPFVPVNCGAISPSLAESEFFGHQRGVFTGADRDRPGLIRAAHGGILFLDEIGELDMSLQAKLLRVLQDHRVRGMGESQEIAVDVRILAATHRDLAAMVRQGTFRADLFHRLSVLCVHVPSLRERPEDIKPLVEHFVSKYQSRFGAQPRVVGADFVEALSRLELPGNARQLENLVHQTLANKEQDGPLTLADLPTEVLRQLAEPFEPRLAPVTSPSRTEVPAPSRTQLHECLAEVSKSHQWNLGVCVRQVERSLLEIALRQAGGKQTEAARMLGITPRTVYNKVRKHNLAR
jgi:DNA-binding NtrC family response regulator